jgi:hypothetical protein
VSYHDSQAASVIGNRDGDVERERGLGLRGEGESDVGRISELSKLR